MALIFDTVRTESSHTHGSANNAKFVGDTWGTKHQTDNGYILLGPANNSHAHIYTDKGSFYLNKAMYVTGGTLLNPSDIRSSIFYDVDNTGYYINPASTGTSAKFYGNLDIYARSAAWSEGLRIRIPTVGDWGGIRWTRDRSNYDGNWALGYKGSGDTTDDLVFWANNGGTERVKMRISKDSKVQIGSSGESPQLTMMFNDSGSGAGWDTAIITGKSDDLEEGTQFPAYVPAGAYGTLYKANSDAVFFGMEEYSSGNYRPIIQWGDDNTDSPFRIKHENSSEFEITYDGHATATSSLRAPIFYDSNDTTYYVNPSDSNISFRGVGEISNSNIYVGSMQAGALNIGRSDTDYAGIGTWASDVRFGIMANCLNDWEFGIHDAGSAVESVFIYQNSTASITMGRDVGWGTTPIIAANSFRAPIFYDSNNTGYYVDPAGTSNLNTLNVGGSAVIRIGQEIFSSSVSDDTSGPLEFIRGSNNWDDYIIKHGSSKGLFGKQGIGWHNHTNSSFHVFSSGWTANFGVNSDGTSVSRSSSRAPIFYDSNNTSYYIDAASTSTLNNLRVNTVNGQDTWEGTITINGDAATYYPVGWYGGEQTQVVEIEVYRNYSETAPSTWNTSSHKGGLVCKIRTNFGGWGGAAYDWKLEDFRETYSTMVAWAGHFANSRAFGLNLRGGGAIYHVRIKGRSVAPTVTLGTWDPGGNSTGLAARTSVDSVLLGRKNHIRGNYLYSYNSEVIHSGSTAQTKTGTLQSDVDFRAPLFYDSNDTNYYIDAGSTGTSIKVRGTIENPSIWINDGDNYNGYNENIRLFNPANGVSVIAFAASGTSGTPTSSILGYSDRHEVRIGSTWRTRLYGGYLQVNGDARATLFYDSGNTAYYINGDSTSRLYDLNVTHFGIANTSSTSRDGISLYNGPTGGEPTYGLLFTGTSLGTHGAVTGSWATYFTMNNDDSRGWIFRKAGTGNCASISGGGHATFDGSVETPFINVEHTGTYGNGMDLTFSGTFNSGLLIRNNTGLTRSAVIFYYSYAANPSVGSINVSSTSTSYNTSSDYRLKENLTPITDGIERVKLLQPKRFNFIIDPEKTVDGFLAHEAQEVVPEAVSGEKDGVDHEGNPEYQGIDQAKLVPLLTAALQEAIAKIEDLESRLQALENQ